MLIQRQYDFEGDDAAYIKHLETRLSNSEKRHFEVPQQLVRCETCARSFTRNTTRNRLDVPQSSRYPERSIAEPPNNQENSSIPRLLAVETGDLESEAIHRAARHADHRQSALLENQSDGASTRKISFEIWDPKVALEPPSRKTSGKYTQTQARLLNGFVRFAGELPSTKDWKSHEKQRKGYHWGDISVFKLDLPVALAKKPSALPTTCPDNLSESASISPSSFVSSTAPSFLSTPLSPGTSLDTLLSGYLNVPEGSEKRNANFRKLILGSACVVASETTHVTSKEQVYRVLKRIYESDANIGRLQFLCRGAKWITKATSLLSTTEWELRSWDIPFLGM
ncbi:hypothetical protein N7540_011038 [Penicillium herquei]|nr:hypothetical protein N7540_011038 [Penicillium herquei]